MNLSRFSFTEEEEAFRQEVRNFCEKELRPGAVERMQDKGDTPIDMQLLKKMGDANLIGIGVPTEYGGSAKSWMEWGIACEEIAKVDIVLSWVPCFASALYLAMRLGSPEELKQKWLPPVCKGDLLPCMMVTEPASGSDVAGMIMTAAKDGGHYILNGAKTAIDYLTQADISYVLAKTDPEAKHKGISVFLVPLSSPGITRTRVPGFGWNCSRGTCTFNNVRIPIEQRLGEEGVGFKFFTRQWQPIRIASGLTAIGAAQASLDEALEYAKQRHAFGKPIASFQAVAFRLADHWTQLEAARFLCYRCFELNEQGVDFAKEAAMCKWFSLRAASQAAHDALIMHGQHGYNSYLPLGQRLADIVGGEIYDGTEDIMKLIIARSLLGRGYV